MNATHTYGSLRVRLVAETADYVTVEREIVPPWCGPTITWPRALWLALARPIEPAGPGGEEINPVGAE